MRQLLSVTIILATLLCAAVAYGPDGNAWIVPEENRGRENPYPASKEVLEEARAVYKQQCIMCHGPSGDGTGQVAKMMGIHPADLTNGEMVGKMTDGEIFYKITRGRDPMPSFEKKIPEAQRWQLVHLVRSFSEPDEAK